MKLSATPFVVRIWVPIMLGAGAFLFFRGMAPESWLLALPLFMVITFMSTLADIHDEGHRIHIKTLWRSTHIPKEDVANIAQSLVEGVGVLRLRRFVFPWGRIYFVSDWSKFGVLVPRRDEGHTDSESERYSWARATLEFSVVGVSGFLAGRALRAGGLDFRLETSASRIGAFTFAGVLFVVFAIARARRPSFAHVVLFVATFVGGLSRW